MDLTNLKSNNNQLSLVNNNNLNEIKTETKYVVDSCFNIPVKQLIDSNDNENNVINNILPSYWNYEDENEQNSKLYTFEEFIQNSSSRSSMHRQQTLDNIANFTKQQLIQSVDQISNEQLTKFSSSLTEDFLRM